MDDEDPEKKKIDLHSSDGLSDFFSDVGDEEIDDEYDEIDQIVDEVMALLENYASFGGGLITYETIEKYLKDGNHPDLDDEICAEVIARLRTNKILEDKIEFEDLPEFQLFIYDGKKLDGDAIKIIQRFIESKNMTLDEIEAILSWEKEIINKTIQELIDMKIISVSDGRYSVPAFNEL